MFNTLIKITLTAAVVSTASMTMPTMAHAQDNWKRLCRPYINAQTRGSDNDVRIAASFCAEVTNIIRGYGNDIDIEVIGNNLVSVTSLGDDNVSTFNVRGADAVIGMIVSNGGRTVWVSNGDNNGTDIFNNGCSVTGDVRGDDNSTSIRCSAD